MKTLLVVAEHSGLAEALHAVLTPDRYRIVTAGSLSEVEPLLAPGMVDACVLDAEFNTIQPIRLIEQLRRWLPACPLVVYATARQWEWEEEAWLLGVRHLLAKPVRGRLLNSLLDRLWGGAETAAAASPPARPAVEPKSLTAEPAPLRTLEVLRHFSVILKHTLCTCDLLRQFLLLLREIIGVNRAALFLRAAPAGFNAGWSQVGDRRLHSVCASGLASGLLQHFELSLDAGIGQFVNRCGRILQRGAEEALDNPEIRKEFELLGVQVAIPILDREALVGVAVFDGPLTGEPFTNEELTLIFHLLEELGLAIRNSWLHDQMAADRQMMLDILDQIGSACVLIGHDLEILHANQCAVRLFPRRDGGKGLLEFSDLPQSLAAVAYESLKPGAGRSLSRFHPVENPDRVYRVIASPFQRGHPATPNAVLLVVEDFTEHERAQRLEIEAANLRLLQTMAEHLAHEIGNSLAPMLAHQQMLAQRQQDPEFMTSLSQTLDHGVHRIARLSQQMLYLAQDRPSTGDPVPVAALLEEAFNQIKSHLPIQDPTLQVANVTPALRVRGDRAALKEALAEVLLNAFQAQPDKPRVEVNCRTLANGGPSGLVVLEVRDSGAGFTTESATRATEPFFTTRVVGLGLGLTVARKVFESHGGKMEIAGPSEEAQGLVRISLPLVQN